MKIQSEICSFMELLRRVYVADLGCFRNLNFFFLSFAFNFIRFYLLFLFFARFVCVFFCAYSSLFRRYLIRKRRNYPALARLERSS